MTPDLLARLATDAAAAPPPAAAGLVFAAGVISSASPCVLAAAPLVIAVVGGTATSRRRSVVLSLAFVVGLALCFTALGAIAALTGRLLGDTGPVWKLVLGALLLLMGAQLAGLLRLKALRIDAGRFKGSGILGAFVLGALTGTLSSPCATPVLVVILSLVAAGQKTVWGTVLLAAYALGHVVLLFVVGAFSGVAASLIASRAATWARRIHQGFGRLLMAAGIWVLYAAGSGIGSALPGGAR